MKQILYISFFLLIPFLAIGQKDRKAIHYQITAGTAIPISTPSTVPFSLQGEILYAFNNRLMAGGGTGLSLYDKEVLIPLFAGMRYNITKPARFTPFLKCDAGYSFAPARDVDGGFYLCPALGMQTSLFSKYAVLLSLGYELQKMDCLKEYATAAFVSAYQESLSHHGLSIKLGVVF